jgi:DNA-binding HxlR family transcriptional regulator
MRAGAHALSLLAVPLNARLLTALADGPRPVTDLRREAGLPPQTTLRTHMQTLTRTGILERRREGGPSRATEYQLGGAGQDLLVVAGILEDWMAHAPAEMSLELGSPAAKSTIKALVDGWSTAIVRAIAARPLSLTELSKLIKSETYPALGRRLGAMRAAGLIEPLPSSDRSTPYVASPWLRRAIAPLAAAARWERRYALGEVPPIGKLDVEASFLLSIPLLKMPRDLSGRCRLAVELRGEGEVQRLAGALVEVRDGRIACSSRLEGSADAWASGSVTSWLLAVIDGDAGQLEVGGDGEIGGALLNGLHSVLFGTPARLREA